VGRTLKQDFYGKVISGTDISDGDSVVVFCGGPYDAKTLAAKGVKNVVITNIDHHDGVKDLAPYTWAYQDAEDVTFDDLSFDWAVVNAGLHHCASPHLALCEMLRVSRKGVIVLEARDSLLMRLANRLGLSPRYETEPALLSGGKWGGYRNTKIPNFIYRWTEREFEKAVNSYVPYEKISFQYHYGYQLPVQRMAMSKSSIKRQLVNVASGFQAVLELFAPRQGNNFAMVAHRSKELKTWLVRDANGEIEVDLQKLEKMYDKAKYQKK
jgi:ubiquinone/menaquinone biosynthesis C-methylase UbiE